MCPEMCLSSPGGEGGVSAVYLKGTNISVYNAELLMPPLALVPLNLKNPQFPNESLQISISQPSFHPQQGQIKVPKGFQSGFAGKEIIFVSTSSVITAGLSLLSPGATEVLPVIKIY